MKINVYAELRLPRLPNYLRYGDGENQMLDVADLSAADVKRIGAAWTAALLQHAIKRRKAKAEGGR